MIFLDRIKETSTSTGTGTFTLGGAVLGYKVFTNGTYKYCIVNETESEWEVGEGTVASGVLTRTTIEASSNGGAAVSFSAGTKFVFNTVSAAYVNSLVPYTGATASVNLGAYGLTSDYLQLSTSPTASGAVGRMLWNDQIGSTETTLKGGSVVLKNGVDLVARVVNKVTPAATLTKATYKAVRVSGAQGQRLAIAYAQANTDNNSADTIGLVCETIAANQEGFIITVGQLTGINTTGSLQGETWADGDVLYLSPTTAGNLTNIKPTGATGHIVVIGYVEYSHAINGSIYVKIMNGWELDELHNVYINAVANNDVLVYESSSTLWKNKSIATILGYTPQAAITLTTTGSSGASTFVSNTLNIPTYTLAGLGGQPQLNGTGFVKATGTTISYDNTTYAADSLVVHLAGAENITGVKTFQNALQTTTGNNLLNTGGGNTVIGYTADPASSATYKLDVNGQSRFVGNLLSFNGSNLRAGLYTSSGWGILDLYYGSLAVRLDPSSNSYMCLGGATLSLGTTTGNNSALLYMQSTVQGLRIPNMTTAQKNLIVSPATSLLVYDTDLAAFQYYTGSAWAGLGGGITGSGTAGQVTYWSGSSAVTGSSNLFWDNTNGRLGIGTSSPAYKLDITNNVDSGTEALRVTNANTGTSATAGISVQSSGAYGALFATSTTYSSIPILGASTIGFYVTKTFSIAIADASSSFRIISGSTLTEKLRLFNGGNLLIQNGGTFTDGGQRLQVIGSMRVGTTAASAMYWDDTNNRLGIGTSSPNSSLTIKKSGLALEVLDASNNQKFAVTDGTVTGSSYIFLTRSDNTKDIFQVFFPTGALTSSNVNWNFGMNGNSNDFVIASYDGTSVTNRMRFGNSGLNAIGTQTPTSAFDITGSTTSRSSLRIRSGTAPTTPNDGDIWYDGTNIYIRVGTTTKTFTII